MVPDFVVERGRHHGRKVRPPRAERAGGVSSSGFGLRVGRPRAAFRICCEADCSIVVSQKAGQRGVLR